jgi:uncharacterized membrane protein
LGHVTFTENFGGIYLTWNLFLAWVPFGIACLVEDLAEHRFIEKWGILLVLVWLLIGGSSILSSYGVYLGRFGRWNSWHVATHPFELVRYIGDNLLQNPVAIQLTLAFSFVMLSTYGVF